MASDVVVVWVVQHRDMDTIYGVFASEDLAEAERASHYSRRLGIGEGPPLKVTPYVLNEGRREREERRRMIYEQVETAKAVAAAQVRERLRQRGPEWTVE